MQLETHDSTSPSLAKATRVQDSIGPDEAEVWQSGLLGRNRRRLFLPLLHVLGTFSVAALSVVLAFVMTRGWLPSGGGSWIEGLWGFALASVRAPLTPEFRPYLAFLLISPLLAVSACHWMGLFKIHHSDIAPFGAWWPVLKGTAVAGGAAALVGLAYSGAELGFSFPVLFFVYNGLLLVFGTLLFHSASLIAVLIFHQLDIGLPNVALLGGGEGAAALAAIYRAPTSAYRLKGHIVLGPEQAAEPALGPIDALADIINEHNLDEIVVTDQNVLTPEARLALAQTCWRMGVDLKLVSPFYPAFHTNTRPEQVGGVPLLNVEKVGLYARWPQLLKRLMDIAIASLAFAATSPILLLAMVAVRLDSPGPVFFVQKRVGLSGRTFNMLKLRSMRSDSDPRIHQEYLKALIKDGAAHEVDKDGKPIFKMTNDPRITRVGRFIRKTSIDELPQLLNVLKGEMSLVGPRPSIPYEVAEYEAWHLRRLNIRPGITGLWQVSGRSRLSYEEMIRLDIRYVEEWSLWLDIKILFKTVPVVLRVGQSY